MSFFFEKREIRLDKFFSNRLSNTNWGVVCEEAQKPDSKKAISRFEGDVSFLLESNSETCFLALASLFFNKGDSENVISFRISINSSIIAINVLPFLTDTKEI